MNHPSTPGLTTRTLTVGVLTVVLAAPVAASTPAQAAGGQASHTRSTTTTAPKAAPSSTDTSKATASRSSSVAYSVPTAFVTKKQNECRKKLPHNATLRRLCVRAQPTLAQAARWKVNLYRAAKYYAAYKMYGHLANRCRHHHYWCTHSSRIKRLMRHGSCGAPWAPPQWHINYRCMLWRSGDAINKYNQLTLFTTSTLSPRQARKLRKAQAALGAHDNSKMSVTTGMSWWKGPYVNVVFKRTTTEAIYQKTRDVTDKMVVATMICAVVGSVTADLVTPLCTGAAALALDDAKAMSAKAHDQGKCLALRVYALSAVVVQGISNPLAVSDCVTSKAALNRTLNRAERLAS